MSTENEPEFRTYLFIGGPIDGQVCTIRASMTRLQVAVESKAPPGWYDHRVYRQVRLRWKQWELPYVAVFVFEDVRDEDVLPLLIRNYTPKPDAVATDEPLLANPYHLLAWTFSKGHGHLPQTLLDAIQNYLKFNNPFEVKP